MSHHEDKRDEMTDDEFDHYLKRGSSLSKLHRHAAEDDVPAELDQKILAQAREAVSDRKIITHPSWWTRWNKPLALAATIMLAVTVIYRVGDRSIDKLASPEATVTLKQDATSPADSSGADNANRVVAKSAAGAVSNPEQAEMKQEPKEPPSSTPPRTIPPLSIKKPALVPEVSFAAPVAPAPPSPVSPEMEKDKAASSGALADLPEKPKQDIVTDSITANDIDRFPDASVAESLQRVPGVNIQRREERAASAKKEKRADPEELLQHIRELRKQGKDKDAMKAWERFRMSFPDYPVAEDDLARMN